ncbi:DsbA family oxidoreductase [Pelagibacterium lentulum]|uniref:DSBA oxidoreductase n=1 Tax=Pelagibacterium lentulum TaxID=2029865 RepID=A0A916R8K3_9HYPH|nr:DsbA family oxidoreductase [Pelagibacterium lentulum]GGA41577.1 DSBA oxidoreductase [Pelagibacterium lentulum]
MSVEIYSDFLCPWCYIGHRKLEKAHAALPSVRRVAIVWRSYQLDPDASTLPTQTAAQAMRGWYPEPGEAEARLERIVSAGRDEGLHIDLERALPVNTFDAHRVSHLAKSQALSEPLNELVFRAYHVEGLNIADHEVLIAIAGEAGLNREEVKSLLATDEFSDSVRADIGRAAKLGIRGVPTLVTEKGERFSATQEHSTLVALLDTAHAGVAQL